MSFSVIGRIGVVPSTGGTTKLTQTITFSSLTSSVYGASDYSPGATASSSLAVSYVSDNTAVATIISNQIHIVAVGICNITASQSGNSSYYPAIPIIQSLTINKATQIITFGSLSSKVFGNANFNVGATSSSGLAITYSSSNTAVATIVSGQIHIVGVGTSNITASQIGNSNYNVATPVIQVLTVNAANQTITFPTLTSVSYGTTDYIPGASASSGLAITYTSSNTAVATIIANNIHVIIPGTTNITASQAGNTNYNIATPITQSLTVNLANQVIVFGVLTIQTVGVADYLPGATSSSGLTITYASSDSTIASIVSGNIHIIAVGSCNITASQVGNANYNAATPVVQTLTVSSSALLTNIDTSFETLEFNSIINHNYNVLRPNIYVIVSSNVFININNTINSNTGQLEINLITGTEQVRVNGILNTSIPTIAGTFILNYSNTAGVLTYN